ncbi:Uu.00g027640.m01.CDS01 [Anthostomella pinea]|uniref:Uu.00g027640.m01.CDS01 n=1 Tax=Anthostomella pinea TaxID=933095 RepID=A0AAI8V7R5_9PEZI|nr:Uu.00g027640.m01.CDS01 [Anthostomella pinea]
MDTSERSKKEVVVSAVRKACGQDGHDEDGAQDSAAVSAAPIHAQRTRTKRARHDSDEGVDEDENKNDSSQPVMEQRKRRITRACGQCHRDRKTTSLWEAGFELTNKLAVMIETTGESGFQFNGVTPPFVRVFIVQDPGNFKHFEDYEHNKNRAERLLGLLLQTEENFENSVVDILKRQDSANPGATNLDSVRNDTEIDPLGELFASSRIDALLEAGSLKGEEDQVAEAAAPSQ